MRARTWFGSTFSMIAVALIGVASLTPAAHAAMISYDLTHVFTGQQPDSTSPWGTIKFDDGGGSGTVTVTVTASLEDTSEFISFWGFNGPDPASGVSIVQGSGPTATINQCSKSDPTACNAGTFKADGDGFYAYVFDFGNGNLNNSDVAVFTITSPGITAASFDETSVGGSNGSYHTAAHLQGINTNGGSCSAWVGDSQGTPNEFTPGTCGAVAEPSILLFVGLGLVGMAGVTRRFYSR